MKDRWGYVYLVRMGDVYKIGWAKDPEHRVRQFARIVLPHPFELLRAIDSEDAIWLEGFLHRKFAEFRLAGEWFRLPEWAIQYFYRIAGIYPEFPEEMRPWYAECVQENGAFIFFRDPAMDADDSGDVLDFAQEGCGLETFLGS